ncbi:hypothetical protein L486_04738 [Kwoniella mangroviensis CBS 10435]|uniref:Uncharacterized protein n=1 Tax=Kwoniella mangroviensis CBS 10435 TaxID=1331196 RepID=A0A1B9INY6_9TREE|nr:hypothetical protein L486_04738 [Kwoniella mangroviensis CBS 10435]
MLQATVIGPAASPGQILYSRRDPGPSREAFNDYSTIFQDQHQETDKPLGRTLQAIENPSDGIHEEYKEEELVWFGKTVVWSRGTQIFRKYTYDLEKEDVSKAVFAWFKTGDEAGSSNDISHKGKQAMKSSATFGPFHQSQNEHWGTPRLSSSSSSSSNSPKLERTLVVFLQTRAHVYYSSGEDVVVHLPFAIDGSWPLSTGGLIVQRALEKRELRKLGKEKRKSGSVLRGMTDHSSMTILDDLMDMEDDTAPSLPRLYTLENPFDELKMIVEGRVEDGFDQARGRLISQTHAIDSSLSILYVSPDPYPFVVTYNCESNEIIFYRKTYIPDQPDLPPLPPNPRTMRPEEILGPPEAPVPIPRSTRAGRPSLHRNPSSFGPSSENRTSSISDPLDRTQRRAPRMSRGLRIAQEHPIATDELQATLDPAPIVPPPSTTKRRCRGLSILSTTTTAQDLNRRTSGASASFVLLDLHDKHDKMGLQAIAEMDLRETTMMMGLERDEVGTRSDLVLDEVWTWRAPYAITPENVSVFLSDNLFTTSVVINLHISQPGHTPHLYPFHAQFRSIPYRYFAITPAPLIECLSAIPIISTRPHIYDVLLLAGNGTLSLMTSGGRRISLQIPLQPREGHEEVARKLASSLRMAVDEKHTRLNSERRILKLLDPIGPRFTIIYEDGNSLRVDADLRIDHHLTRQCFEALSYVIPPQQFFFVKREFLSSLQQLPSIQRRDDGQIWKIFSSVIRAMIQIEGESQPTNPFETLVHDGQISPNSIARRLAQRMTRNTSATRALSTTGLMYNETLRLEDTAPIMLALHFVAQDLRLSSIGRKEIGRVVRLISDLASKMGREDWKDYWARIVPCEVSNMHRNQGITYDTTVLDQFDAPPDIMAYLHQQLITRTKPFPSPISLFAHPASSELGYVNPCRQTTLITGIFSYFTVPNSSREAAAVKHMVRAGLDLDWLSDLPYGIAIPILETLRFCQHNPPKDWDAKMYELIARWDLGIRAMGEANISGREEPELDFGLERISTIKELVGTIGEDKKKPQQPVLPHARFGSDRRVQEVERIMQTTRVRTIAVQDPKGASESDVVRYHQTVVNTLANRTLSIPVGQGMFEFGSRSTNITDVWNIPLIELSVKVGPGKPTLKAEIVSDSAEWPCFHNGVAAGLAISPECKGIDSSWIIFNRPNVLNAEHGGFLLALGLNGHLRSLMTYHAFPLLEPRHDFTSVGLLLGLACSYAGSEDLLITKVLSLHTHALLPLGSMELNASPIIQSSALVGLGLVYAGSRNLRMAEVTLSEVGRKEMPNVDGFADYQESYSFSAAMAFGLIMLGKGGESTSEVERRMLTQLRRCILGDTPVLEGTKARSALPTIDNNITGPGATLALGLMYLKSGRRDIADMISIPQSTFELDQVRPDLLLLRTFARSLILWEEITPMMGWVEDQLPQFVKTAHDKGHNHKRSTNHMELSTELAYLNIVSGACFAIGMKYAGTATEMAHTNLMTFFGVLSKAATGSSMTYEGRIRRTAARQGLNIVTLALAMVMSGTGELSVLRRLRVSHGQEGAGVTYGSHMAMHMALGMLFLGRGHYTLGNSNLSIAVMSIAFFPRFLGSPGDNKSYPQAFRHLWALAVEPRCLVAKDVDTLETVYLPVKLKVKEQTPGASTSTIDLQQKKSSSGTVKVRSQSLISPTLISPFENISSIEIDSPRYWSVKYDCDTPKDKLGLIRNRTIYVKRKLGFLDYNSDPKGNRSLFVRAGSMTGIDLHYDLISYQQPTSPTNSSNILGSEEVEGLVRIHSSDPALIRLSKLFNNNNNAGESGNDRQRMEINSINNFIEIVLLECLSLDKPHLIPVYLDMYMSLQRSSKEWGLGVEELNQLVFIRYFYDKIYDKSFNSSSSTLNEKRFPLVRMNFVNSLIRRLAQPTSTDEALDSVVRYLRGEEKDIVWTEELVKYIWKKNIPPLPLLDMLREKIRQSAIDREVLVLKVRDVSEGYRKRILGQYGEPNGLDDGVVEGEGWKKDSVRETIRVWTE